MSLLDVVARSGYGPAPSDEDFAGDEDGDALDDRQAFADDSEVFDDEEIAPFGAGQDELWDE